jgi:hypothetical protein
LCVQKAQNHSTLVYNTKTEPRLLILVNTLSADYALAADLIIQLSKSMSLSGFISEGELGDCGMYVFKEKSVPRRFVQI